MTTQFILTFLIESQIQDFIEREKNPVFSVLKDYVTCVNNGYKSMIENLQLLNNYKLKIAKVILKISSMSLEKLDSFNCKYTQSNVRFRFIVTLNSEVIFSFSVYVNMKSSDLNTEPYDIEFIKCNSPDAPDITDDYRLIVQNMRSVKIYSKKEFLLKINS